MTFVPDQLLTEFGVVHSVHYRPGLLGHRAKLLMGCQILDRWSAGACRAAGNRVDDRDTAASQRLHCPRWGSAIRAGSREICISPSSGWAMSSITNIAPETDSAQNRRNDGSVVGADQAKTVEQNG